MANMMINGYTVDEVYDKVVQAGVSAHDAALLVSGYISQVVLGGTKQFGYTTSFPAVEAGCQVAFARTFSHTDWVDGESVVQAEETASEEGFNARFHAIEHDFDALSTVVGQLSLCMAEMRSSLASLLDEIRAEFNRLEAAGGGSSISVPPSIVDPTLHIPPLKYPTDPGMPNYLGATTYFGRDVHVWDTGQGIITLPSVDPVALGGMENIRVQRVAALGQLLTVDSQLSKAIAKGETKADLVEQFGTVQAPGGQTFGDLVDILPDAAKYSSADALLSDVSAGEARALRTTPNGTDTIRASLGTDQFSSAGIDRLSMLPAGAVTALKAAGIDTVGKLADTSAQRIASIVKAQAPAVTSADVAGWSATASMLVGMSPVAAAPIAGR